MTHLWEINHDYYCETQNYFANENTNFEFKSLDDFLEEFGDSDFDMNLLFRWDWELPEEPSEDICYRDGTLKIFWMGQRKGLYQSSTISVCKADEERIKNFLQPRLNHLCKLWEPLTPETKEASNDA